MKTKVKNLPYLYLALVKIYIRMPLIPPATKYRIFKIYTTKKIHT
jgi:hypothetical protein